MIKCHLSRMMGEHKMRVIDVARRTGIHRNMVNLLYRETASRVDLETVDKLCRLFNCGVGELFEYVPDEPPKKRARRPMP
ncbi:MAG: helix-turn-helix transcriptional regulator [Gammaproteobacteria bacterium]|nr:helix-turn-helix transcriptional regulator [Gammaproteobacteria bacterium]